jgi:hypothetical protein
MSLLAEQKICKQERFAPERGCLLSFNFTGDLYCILKFLCRMEYDSYQCSILYHCFSVVRKAGDKHMWYSWSQHRGTECMLMECG